MRWLRQWLLGDIVERIDSLERDNLELRERIAKARIPDKVIEAAEQEKRRRLPRLWPERRALLEETDGLRIQRGKN